MQLGTGTLRTARRTIRPCAFTRTEIGLIGSAHFLGFIIGCFASPYLVRRAGHARTFSFVTGLSVIAVLLHPLLESLWFWIGLRLVSGIAVAGAATVIESWLNAKLTNEKIGRATIRFIAFLICLAPWQPSW